MNLTRLLCRVILVASGCASMWAQTAPLMPSPVVPNPVAPKPFQFDASQYKGLLPGWPVVVKPTAPIAITRQILLGNKPCAVARIMKPDPAIDPKIDPQMIPRNPGPTPMPIEVHSRDITETNVPAPSCADAVSPQQLNAGPEKR
jgi:hypothetical protein